MSGGSPRIARARLNDGMRWLPRAGEMLGRGGMPLVHIGALFLAITTIQLVPLVGMLALIIITPVLTAGLLNAFAVLDAGKAPTLGDFLAGFTQSRTRPALLVLGGVLLIGVMLALSIITAWLAPQVDLERLSAIAADTERVNQDPGQLLAPLAEADWLGGVLLAGGVMMLVLGALFFAVPLVFFWRWPVSTALIWGLRALLLNWVAMLGHALMVVAFLLVLGFLLGLFSGLVMVALGSAGAFLVQLVMMVVSIFVQLLMVAAQWRAFCVVFPSGPDSSAPNSDVDDDSDDDGGSLTA